MCGSKAPQKPLALFIHVCRIHILTVVLCFPALTFGQGNQGDYDSQRAALAARYNEQNAVLREQIGLWNRLLLSTAAVKRAFQAFDETHACLAELANHGPWNATGGDCNNALTKYRKALKSASDLTATPFLVGPGTDPELVARLEAYRAPLHKQLQDALADISSNELTTVGSNITSHVCAYREALPTNRFEEYLQALRAGHEAAAFRISAETRTRLAGAQFFLENCLDAPVATLDEWRTVVDTLSDEALLEAYIEATLDVNYFGTNLCLEDQGKGDRLRHVRLKRGMLYSLTCSRLIDQDSLDHLQEFRSHYHALLDQLGSTSCRSQIVSHYKGNLVQLQEARFSGKPTIKGILQPTWPNECSALVPLPRNVALENPNLIDALLTVAAAK